MVSFLSLLPDECVIEIFVRMLPAGITALRATSRANAAIGAYPEVWARLCASVWQTGELPRSDNDGAAAAPAAAASVIARAETLFRTRCAQKSTPARVSFPRDGMAFSPLLPCSLHFCGGNADNTPTSKTCVRLVL
jgi:hypothetical protein